MCPPSAGATHRWEPAPTAPSPPAPSCVPSDKISQAAYALAARTLHPDILAHSLRVYLLAYGLGSREHSPLTQTANLHLLFTACVLHDLGTSEAHNGPQRFEVEAADAAKRLLLDHGVEESKAHDVWSAIALHATPGIAERYSPLSRLVRLGVAADFKRSAALRLVPAEEVGDVEREFPRGEIERVLGDVVVRQVLGWESEGLGAEVLEGKAPGASWAGGMVRWARENEGWEGVNGAF